MKKQASKGRKRPVKYDHAGFWRRWLTLIIFSVIVTLIVEGFNQATPARMIRYLSERTVCFALNCLITLTIFSISELFRHRKAINWTLAALLIILGFANYMVSRNRTLPLSSGDLILTYEIVSMVTVYFSWFEIIGAFILAVALIVGIAWMFSATAKRKRINYAFSLGTIAIMVLLVFGVHMSSIKAGLLPDVFPDRVNSYRDYGFTTCFTFTFGQHGIEKPDDYSTETVEEILEEIEEETEAPQPAAGAPRFDEAAMEKPNIVYLQLESFFDLDTMVDTELSADPTPNFHRLMEEWPTGMLYVPTVGGGTANVEFEVMSGMNMDFFGAGETPYNSIIQKVTCETIAHTLRDHGYHSTALHNNIGTFFSRNQVYANLGYDCFDSLEYMANPEYNRVGWARDAILTDEILRAMENSAEQDLIFAIAVESHGKYGETYTPEPGNIEVLSAPEEIYLEPFRNYVNLIRPVDDFLGDVLAALQDYDEPVVAIIYGDHLPGVGLTSEMLENGDFYASKYVIWNNYGAEFETPDMQAYRLSAELLRQLGIHDGVMTKFHQTYPVDEAGEDYLEKLRILEYDLLYGDQEAYGEAGAPAPTALSMGIEPIEVHSADLQYGRLMVSGRGFTEYSVVVTDDRILDTVYIDSEHIAVDIDETDAEQLGEGICVAQVNAESGELSRTETIGFTVHNYRK